MDKILVIGIAGGSGSGKTTLLKYLTGEGVEDEMERFVEEHIF